MALTLGIIVGLIGFVVFVGCFIRVGVEDDETVSDSGRDEGCAEGSE